jgi:hypothetical protein
MHIQLKENIDSEGVKLLHKFYKVPFNERVIINTILDKLYNQDKFEWTIKSTSYIFSIFIVWRMLYKDGILIRKDRAVVDIREFNKAAVSDIYLISLQSDIIRVMLDCKYISVMNGIDFFLLIINSEEGSREIYEYQS